MPLYGINNYIHKHLCIRRLTIWLARGWLRFTRGSQGARQLVEQLRDFPHADHDDGPDALETAIRLGANVLSSPE